MSIYSDEIKLKKIYWYDGGGTGSIDIKKMWAGLNEISLGNYNPIIYEGSPVSFWYVDYDVLSVFKSIQLDWQRKLDGTYGSVIISEYGFFFDEKTGGEGLVYTMDGITEFSAPSDSFGFVKIYGIN